MKLFIYIFSILVLFTSNTAVAQMDCSPLKEGTFVYLNTDEETIFIVIDKKYYTEYYEEGKYMVQSKIKWKDDCSFVLKMNRFDLPNFNGKKGDKLEMTVVKIIDRRIVCRAQFNDKKWNSTLLDIEELPENVLKTIAESKEKPKG